MRFFRSLRENESGATAIEYAIMCALVALGIIAGFDGAKTAITTIGQDVVTALNAE